MASSTPYKATIQTRENGPEIEIPVNPVSKEDVNWTIRHKGGNLYFGTKADVEKYLKRKYHSVKV